MTKNFLKTRKSRFSLGSNNARLICVCVCGADRTKILACCEIFNLASEGEKELNWSEHRHQYRDSE